MLNIAKNGTYLATICFDFYDDHHQVVHLSVK